MAESADQFSVVTAGKEGEPAVLAVVGEVDLYTAPRLGEALAGVIDAGVRQVVLDLSRLSFIDSSGLHAIAAARQRLGAEGGSLVLRSVRPETMRVLDICGLSSIVETISATAGGSTEPT